MPISVVVSQAQRQDPTRRDFEEQLVTMLIMEDDHEVQVVPHLETLDEGDTGLLCLEGLTAHIVALSWMPPEAAFARLQDLGIPGRFGRSRHATQIPDAWRELHHPRAIYCLDLAQFPSLDEAREEVRRIDREQAVQVFSIGSGLPISSAPSADAKPQPRDPQPDPPPADPQPASPDAAEQRADDQRPNASSGADAPNSANGADGADDSDPEAELDRLIDELDQLDL